MNAMDAARMTVQAYPGGAESLGPRIGMTGPLLRSKLNSSDRNQFYLTDAELLLEATGDHRLLHEIASNHGYTLQPIVAGADDASVLDLVLRVGKTGGELSKVICEALRDGVITPNEMAAISRASHDDQSAVLRLVGRLLHMVPTAPND